MHIKAANAFLRRYSCFGECSRKTSVIVKYRLFSIIITDIIQNNKELFNSVQRVVLLYERYHGRYRTLCIIFCVSVYSKECVCMYMFTHTHTQTRAVRVLTHVKYISDNTQNPMNFQQNSRDVHEHLLNFVRCLNIMSCWE